MTARNEARNARTIVQADRIEELHLHNGPWLTTTSALLSGVSLTSIWLWLYELLGRSAAGPFAVLAIAAVAGLVAVLVARARRAGRTAAARIDQQQAAKLLHATVFDQWEGEWRERGLDELLPVRWSDGHTSGTDLRDAFDHRLVVLGEAGSGKTVLATRLTLDLLEARRPEDPVPVLLALAQWQPERQQFHDWLIERIESDCPALAGSTGVADLVRSRGVLPVLDGLDELTPEAREVAIEAFTKLDKTERFVLTSRPVDLALKNAKVVRLERLAVSAVADHFAALGDHWRPVVDRLLDDPDAPLAEVLTNPFMTFLASSTCYPERLLTATDLRTHLLESFVDETYDDRARPAGTRLRPTHRGAGPRRWLSFLARYLQHRGTPNLAWWELRRAIPRGRLETAVGVLAGAVFGPLLLVLGPYALGLGIGPIAGLLLGGAFCVGYSTVRASSTPHVNRPRDGGFRGLPLLRTDVLRRFRYGTVTVGTAWVIALLVARPALAVPSLFAIVVGVSGSLVIGLVIGVIAGAWLKTSTEFDLAVATVCAPTPGDTLRRDRLATLVVGTVFGIAVGVVTGVVLFVASGSVAIASSGALGGAITGGPAAITMFTAWAAYVPVRVWLSLSGKLPWRLQTFLADAHRLAVLRQFGALYQFRHLQLQEQLAISDRTGPRRPR